MLHYTLLETTTTTSILKTMIVARRTISRLNITHLTRGLSSRASNILSSLGISTTEELSGVYDGEWRGSGEIFKSVCPTTGETLARVKTATPQELHDALGRTREAYTIFRSACERLRICLKSADVYIQMFLPHAEGRFCGKFERLWRTRFAGSSNSTNKG